MIACVPLLPPKKEREREMLVDCIQLKCIHKCTSRSGRPGTGTIHQNGTKPKPSCCQTCLLCANANVPNKKKEYKGPKHLFDTFWCKCYQSSSSSLHSLLLFLNILFVLVCQSFILKCILKYFIKQPMRRVSFSLFLYPPHLVSPILLVWYGRRILINAKSNNLLSLQICGSPPSDSWLFCICISPIKYGCASSVLYVCVCIYIYRGPELDHTLTATAFNIPDWDDIYTLWKGDECVCVCGERGKSIDDTSSPTVLWPRQSVNSMLCYIERNDVLLLMLMLMLM